MKQERGELLCGSIDYKQPSECAEGRGPITTWALPSTKGVAP